MRSIIVLIGLLFATSLSAQQLDSKQTYLAELKLLGKSFSNEFYPQYDKIYALPSQQFRAKIEQARSKFDAVLLKYQKTLDKTYVEDQQLEIKYYFDKLLIDYPVNHDIYIGKTSKQLSGIPESLKKNLIGFNDPQLLTNGDFVNYVKAFFAYQLNLELRKPAYRHIDNQQLNAIWKLIPRYVSNQKCKDFWTAEYLYQHMDNNGVKNLQTIYANFKSSCRDTALLNKVATLYAGDLAGRRGHLVKAYKKIGTLDLDLHIFLPDSLKQDSKRPVMVYFHGGSWSEGKPDWFFDVCQNYAKKGWVACAVEYRTYSRQGTLPFEAVKDAKSAIRWLRQHANELNIDPNRIVASGNSAGGHLVLSTALADQWNEKTDDLSFSSVPNVLLVNAGVYDLTDRPTAWIRKDLKDKNMVKEISPNFLIKANLPPTLILHGTDDQSVPYQSAQKFVEQSKQKGNTSIEFYPLEKAGHFIWFDPKYAPEVNKTRNDFLKKLGY
ncbi:alpha/beta hydrolase [Pedobacter sp. Hv1]|uniref:alpha/beta hydrolase n=1 Tax=Pedobacter sp. Hv1 TaxID=1740090 RepID=UPI0006D8AD84|nr:alpha/beta hydrolase [Pedobacter sp. Hv1]KQC01801.1 hypothetical protein AQF98_05395 [Pedobacter sp. Hv1]